MAENKNAKKAAEAAKAAEETVSVTPAEHVRREKKKSRWTLETCQRAARRFNTRDEWAYNAPSSYKAATAKGWDIQCCAHMAPSHKPSAHKKSDSHAKVAAKPKTKTKVSRSA